MNLHVENMCSQISDRQMELLDVEERIVIAWLHPSPQCWSWQVPALWGILTLSMGTRDSCCTFQSAAEWPGGQVSFCRYVLTYFVSKMRSPFHLAWLKGAKQERALMFWTCATSSSARHPSQNHIPKLSSSTKTAWLFLPANRNPWNPRCLAALGRWHTQSEQAMFSMALCLLPSALTRKDSAERAAETQHVSHGQSLCEGLLWPSKGLHVFAKSLAKLRSG